MVLTTCPCPLRVRYQTSESAGDCGALPSRRKKRTTGAELLELVGEATTIRVIFALNLSAGEADARPRSQAAREDTGGIWEAFSCIGARHQPQITVPYPSKHMTLLYGFSLVDGAV
ncbi:uncharacterized protein LOC112127564 [Cimex lectularius]|uniref:Uncharacterized protein n=1 Tax=Cimex lectularius TaxID=79782 RepID=A0A8I6TKS9_CIMLE|nr:uncharacterized protein LOC112127564 [Cimex lectularius]